MAFNPVAMLAERTCAPIYNAIDTGNNTLAVRHADRILHTQPELALASALKALALVRSAKRDEANTICTQLIARGLPKGHENALTPLTWCLGRLGRRQDEVALLETAVKNNPNDEDLARQTFLALIKCQSFQKAQQLSLKMHKSFAQRKQGKGRFADEYFWWSILSYVLLARDAKAPGAALALPLSQRMIEKQIETKPLGLNDEEALCLQLQVLVRQGKKAEAFELVATEGSVGHALCDRNLSLEFTRTDLARELNKWQYVEQSCWARIDGGSRNWAHFSGFLDAAEKRGKDELMAAHKKINVLLSVKGAVKDRSVRLAELEVWRKRMQVEPEVEAQLYAKVAAYFDTFGTKACCHEDLLPYLGALSSDSRSKLSAALKEKTKPLSVKTEAELRTYISIAKITRAVQTASGLSEESEAALAAELVARYVDGLSVGKDLPETEMQPADDIALLAVQALLSAYRLSGGKLVYLFQVIGLLEFGLTKSSKGYQLRMLLIRSYTLAGAVDRALIHYGLLGLKSVQADTLSHLVSERCSAFSATGRNAKAADEGTYKMAVRTLSTAQAIYEENANSTPEMIGKALEHGIYSRVEEFVEFGEALERSLQRQVVRLEEARSHLHRRGNFADDEQRSTFGAAISNSVASVRADLAAGLSDQRDYSVLVNYQPMATPSVEELTQVGPRQDAGWVRSIALTLADDEGGAGIKDEDLVAMTEREKALVELVASARNGSFEASRLLELLEAVKTTTRTVVDVVGGGAGGAERMVRPVDVVHEVGLALEAVYHTEALLDAESKAACQTHLAELATLVNHLTRSTQQLTKPAVLEQGLAAVGAERVAQLMQSTRDNVARCWTKVFANLRDALRDAL